MTENERAIQALKKLRDDCYEDDGYGNMTDECAEELWAIDTAIEALKKRKTGKWVIQGGIHNMYTSYACSECGREIEMYYDFGNIPTDEDVINEFPYCHCGAKMEV